ncbi:MAG: phage integrase family protein [Bacteroidetes bacterium]|nr:phage integrase family protein [Bacteroidota bacterium]
MNEYRDVHGSKIYLERSLARIDSSSMSSEQKILIRRFIQELKIGKAGKKVRSRRIVNYLQFLQKLHEYFQKDLDKITESESTKLYTNLQDDIIRKNNGMPYAQASKDEYVKTIKRYLGWRWGKNSIKYRKSISWMKEDYKGSDKNAITLQQAEEIVKNEENLRNQCLFMFAFDSGGRIEEILNVRIKDLTISCNGNKYYNVYLRGEKTPEAKRTIPLPIVSSLLSEWLKCHPTRQEDDYVFPLMYDNAKKIIRQMSERILEVAIKPHELRHSSATHYIQYGGFGAENIGGFYYRYGWKFGSKEALTYIKTYLYSGEIGSNKVVKAIESNRVDKLQEEIEVLNERLRDSEGEKGFMALLTGVIVQQKMMSEVLSELTGKSFNIVLPKATNENV